MTLVRPLLCTIALLSSAATTHTTDNGLEFSHADWQLVCDNTRTCRAAGYAPEYGEDGASVLLTRHAGPGQPVNAELQVSDTDEPAAADLHLHIDGNDLGVLGTAKQGGYALGTAQTTALLAALLRDSRIHVEHQEGRRWELSDQGAAAALLKMDEFQGRLDTPGALVRRGTRNEASVPPSLPAPVVFRPPLAPPHPGDGALARSPELRTALRATLDGAHCERFDELPADTPLQVDRLDGHRVLVSTPCWLAIYNAGSGYWIANDHAPFQPQLVTTRGTDYDAGQISADHKGRGLGDCWSHTGWTWDGSHFVLTSDYQTGMCRGMPGGFWVLPTLVSEVLDQATTE
ncbi:Regulatory protein [uncultured Stenotrophomonas sp.]|uniref:Regulatory protein n=1 Tax=uncultured Stenotrophomonas sp. TaxID=165438 RepID=A0A1Y5Q1Q7_9GAMM|nr:Regulatory protein [uncultured Stenotrophomonas sp.]